VHYLSSPCTLSPLVVHSLSRLCTSIHPLRLLSAFIPSVTCRWHVLLDVSWVGSVTNSTEVTVLRSDPEPLLPESVGELMRVFAVIRVNRDDGTGEYPARTR
jgi:hypothetical protein